MWGDTVPAASSWGSATSSHTGCLCKLESFSLTLQLDLIPIIGTSRHFQGRDGGTGGSPGSPVPSQHRSPLPALLLAVPSCTSCTSIPRRAGPCRRHAGTAELLPCPAVTSGKNKHEMV